MTPHDGGNPLFGGFDSLVTRDKFLYSYKEAAQSLGICERSLRHIVRRGDLQTRRIGKRVLIPREALRRYALADHPEAIVPDRDGK